MISVLEAIKRIEPYCKSSASIFKPIYKTLGYVLATDVLSPINMPPFKQSSMDGYAFFHSGAETYTIVGEIKTGSSKNIDLKPGEAVRIFTGAKVPDNADTVIMQELVNRSNENLTLTKQPVKGSNVRVIGEQIKKGHLALEKGTVLNEAAVGFLAGLGVERIQVFKRPKVAVLVTGDEIKKAGEELLEGQIYDSNAITLKLALNRLGVKKPKVLKVNDDLVETKETLKRLLNSFDVILISGGISVGDYDFVKEALVQNDVQEVFYKVNQKPGKPLWFGHKGETLVFALPGNPASTLTCFYVYVLPLLKAKMGFESESLKNLEAEASEDIRNTFNKTLFLKGVVNNGKATALTGQASSMLKSFAVSSALIIIPEDKTIIKKGEQVTYLNIN